jgi:hypothetical protein
MAQAGQTRPAGRPQGGSMHNTMHEHKDLLTACISAGIAAILMAYVVTVQKPAAFHLILALASVGAITWAYLLVGRSSATSEQKAGAIVGAAIVAGICFEIVTYLSALLS